MSRRVKSPFASKTAFEALAVSDPEEEADDDQEEQLDSPAENSAAEGAQIQTRSAKAAKRAAFKARRLEKKAQRSSSKGARSAAGTDEELQRPSKSKETPGSKFNPVEIPPEHESDTSGVLVEAEPSDQTASHLAPVASERVDPALNGRVHEADALEVQLEQPLAASTPPSKNSALPTSSSGADTPVASQASTTLQPSSKPNDKLAEVSQPIPAAPTDKESSEKTKKRQSFLVRTLWTLIMIGIFLLCLMGGHAYMVILVMACQTLVYREVTALFAFGAPKSEDNGPKGKDPWSKTLNWYFFVVTNFFLYGESIIYYFKHVVFADWHFSVFAANHRFASFSLWTIGFVGFVYSLQRQYLKSQFGLFCWVHMSLLVIVVSSHFIMNNILEGLIWFWVPASLVICNDIFAYICGISFGRTPLIQLSPKKTVEGFVGAFFCTILFGQIWGTFFMRFNYMICPAQNLGANAFSNITCTPNPVFVWRNWELPLSFRMLLAAVPIPGTGDITTIPYAPYQFHLLVMSCFASLVAPFGGFFASGFKRAFGIKDFGHSIPGHGGMTDRMDCQFLMGVFTYVYYSSLVKEHHVTVGHVLQLIVSGLSLEEQVELMGDFKRYLEGRGITV